MRRHLPIALASVLLIACAACAADSAPFVSGPWTVTVGEQGPAEITYQGEPLVRNGALGGYKPGWQGPRFSLAGCRVARAADRIVWTRSEAGNQDATLTLELRPMGFRLSLETALYQAGPSEFSLNLLPAALQTTPETCMAWVDGSLRSIPLGWPFETVRGIEEIRFERPERTVSFRCPWFDLQDRRAGGGEMFLVRVIDASAGFPQQVSSFIDCEVIPAAAADVAGRQQVLTIPPEERSPVDVPNGDFEAAEPLARWGANPLAALDPQVAHDGRQSARLRIAAVQAPSADPYLIQQIPVQPDHLYQVEAWIRPENVEAAVIGDRGPTGATVILEFADTKGQWLASGSYAQGLYGTQGWQHVVGAPARAPEGAGYAVIYLALRAVGSAWFDGVALREVRRNVIPLQPLPGARVADNTPTLNWTCGWKGRAVLELSRDPAFPADTTLSRSLDGLPPFTLDAPIPPGDWHWRVRVPEISVNSPAWTFAQTTPLDQDTTEPTIVEQHGTLASPEQPVPLRCADNVGVTIVRLAVDGQDVGAVPQAAGEARYVPRGGWTAGLHKISVTATDAAGNAATRQLFWTRCAPLPRTTWEASGGVRVDGQKRFYLGLYGVHEPDFAEVSAAGFHFVHSYRWDGTGTSAEAVVYMDAAQGHGLQAFMGISRQQLMKANLEFVAERVGALMGHPGLLAWYLYDEPDLEVQYVSPELMARYYRLIKALDPYHPVILTCAGDSAVPLYRDHCDVYWPQVYSSAAFVADRLDRTRAMLPPDKPLMGILHCYDPSLTELQRRHLPVDLAAFQPDAATLRGNAFMALAHGSSCLTWWEYEKQSPDFISVGHNPPVWEAFKRSLADIRWLEPVLTADGEVRTWVETPAPEREVHLWEKRLPGRTVLIAVNRDRAPTEVGFEPRWVPAGSAVKVEFENRELRLQGARLTDAFGPLEAHVYTWTE